MSGRDALSALFEPAAVAFIGASSDPYKLGGRPIRFLRDLGYAGAVYPVNPAADTIQGLPAFRRLDAIPGPLEHAVIVVPAAACEAALEACVRKGVRVVQIFTSGFAEVGAEGAAMQQRLLERARAAGIRLLGPNCLGVVSPANRFFATFSTALEALVPQPGAIALATQSGAFGSCAYATAIQRGIGLSRVVATGNEADIDVAECIAWLAGDERTQVICAAIEGCRDGDRLREALRTAARAGKPVVVMKVGASEVGSAAAATHTGALAGNDAVFDAVFRDCAAYRAHSIEQMLDIAALCVNNPLPANGRAGIVTLSGGIGVLMADAAQAQGLELPPMPPAAAAALRDLAPFAAVGNPMDTTAQIAAVKDGLLRALRIVLEGTDWGTVFLYMAQKAAEPKAFAAWRPLLQALRREHPQRCIVLVGPCDEGVRRELETDGLTLMADPSRAVAAAGAAATLRRRRELLIADEAAARDLSAVSPVVIAPAHTGGVLAEDDAKRLLAAHGLPVLPEQTCASADEAVAAARHVGFPVVAKIVSPDIAHKTEIGGVMLGLKDEAAVRDAYAALLANARRARPEARIAGVLIAPMAPVGVETILGVQRDSVFGPMVMVGLGGVAVELFQDVAFACAPLTPAQAERLVRRVRAARLLDGWRGAPPSDMPALIDALVKLSHLALAPGIESVEINPFVVLPEGGLCLDAVVALRRVG